MLNRLRRALAALMHQIAEWVSPMPKMRIFLSVDVADRARLDAQKPDRHVTKEDVADWAERIGPKTA